VISYGIEHIVKVLQRTLYGGDILRLDVVVETDRVQTPSEKTEIRVHIDQLFEVTGPCQLLYLGYIVPYRLDHALLRIEGPSWLRIGSYSLQEKLSLPVQIVDVLNLDPFDLEPYVTQEGVYNLYLCPHLFEPHLLGA
jgi:hypothetical protein